MLVQHTSPVECRSCVVYAQDSILCQFGPRNLSPVQQLISPSILVHFWWELYQYLGVPIRDKSYMFGDNRSVVTSSTIPNSTISKRHHLASYHRVREAIAAKFISFHWKDGKSNSADILSKHWEFATVWPLLKPILFWRGDTATQLKGSDRIPSTTPGAEPPRDAKDSGSARSHPMHLETSSSDRP